MPINDNPPFNPTHGPNYEDYGKLYVPTELANTVAPYTSGGIISATSTYSADIKEIERLKKELEVEHEKRLQAETREAVLKVRLENKVENKQDDEDEIDRLTAELLHHKKIHRDAMFILADAATSPSGSTYSNINHQNILRQIVQALKQEPKKM